jgi:hypothetical protein
LGRTCFRILFVLAAVSAAPVVSAQTTAEPDTSRARVRIGPLSLNPTIELTNLGVDSNVFNEPEGEEKRDFTFTVTPKTDAWIKFGRTWITGAIREDVVWYQTYSSERSGNTAYNIGWTVPLNRLAFGVAGTYLSTRDRPGFEIDARSQRAERGYKGLVEYRALAKTFFGVRAEHLQVDFDKDEIFLGESLADELNRSANNVSLAVRHQLTPLTSISVDVGRSQDRFEFSPLRDSDSTVAGVQVTFDPFALIKGTARIGYRNFVPADKSLPGYAGSIAAVDLTYTLMGTTRLTLNVGRDVQYSYDVNQPYYLQTGITGSFAQQIYGPLDAVVRAGIQKLNYQDRIGEEVEVSNRTDEVLLVGGGFGYHLGRDLRLGFNVDKQKRVTDVSRRKYNTLRFGMSVTYGL